jgi:spastin
MVRKTKVSNNQCTSNNTDASENSQSNETEKKTLIILSFPIVMLFNLIKTILFELFIVLKFIYNSSSRILNKPTVNQEGNLEVVKSEENKDDEMDMLQKQKHHHKKAFEKISQALKIDETQNTGNVIV